MLVTFLLRLTLVTSSRVFPTTVVVVVVVLVAGVEPAVEMATPLLELLLILDDDEVVGGSLVEILVEVFGNVDPGGGGGAFPV